MRKPLLGLVMSVVIAIAVYAAHAQQAPAQNAPAQNPPQGQAQGQQPGRGRAGGADPYVNNAAPGTLTFPLAAPAGKDSNAKNVAPMGAVNTGPFDPAAWKYGTAFDAPPGSKVWNPAKLKLMQGGKVTGGTL